MYVIVSGGFQIWRYVRSWGQTFFLSIIPMTTTVSTSPAYRQWFVFDCTAPGTNSIYAIGWVSGVVTVRVLMCLEGVNAVGLVQAAPGHLCWKHAWEEGWLPPVHTCDWHQLSSITRPFPWRGAGYLPATTKSIRDCDALTNVCLAC